MNWNLFKNIALLNISGLLTILFLIALAFLYLDFADKGRIPYSYNVPGYFATVIIVFGLSCFSNYLFIISLKKIVRLLSDKKNI